MVTSGHEQLQLLLWNLLVAKIFAILNQLRIGDLTCDRGIKPRTVFSGIKHGIGFERWCIFDTWNWIIHQIVPELNVRADEACRLDHLGKQAFLDELIEELGAKLRVLSFRKVCALLSLLRLLQTRAELLMLNRFPIDLGHWWSLVRMELGHVHEEESGKNEHDEDVDHPFGLFANPGQHTVLAPSWIRN